MLKARKFTCRVDTCAQQVARGKLKFPHLILVIPSALSTRDRMHAKWWVKNRMEELTRNFVEEGLCPTVEKTGYVHVVFDLELTYGKSKRACDCTYVATNVVGLRRKVVLNPVREVHVKNKLY